MDTWDLRYPVCTETEGLMVAERSGVIAAAARLVNWHCLFP